MRAPKEGEAQQAQLVLARRSAGSSGSRACGPFQVRRPRISSRGAEITAGATVCEHGRGNHGWNVALERERVAVRRGELSNKALHLSVGAKPRGCSAPPASERQRSADHGAGLLDECRRVQQLSGSKWRNGGTR
jgi:hypothetical protein